MNRLFVVALLLLSSLLATTTVAQEMPQPLPIDSNVRYGVLDNGLTYYIRHNELPKDRAEFYIAQKVGSVLEEEEQRGLAHFLEHMAFNGTTNFPGKSMLNYLESIGVKFGENVNAYTGFDETVYNLSNVPVLREGVIDTCLLVLHDWASQIALEETEIDSERGVIQEEWRTRNGANQRIWELLVPEMFAGSQYANRMPIGTMDVVMNFSYQTLRDYYHKWYRPDQQGIIIVGDIDAEEVEKKVIELFGAIEMPEDAAERIQYEVPNNVEPIIVVGKDKEATRTDVMVFYKHDPMPREAEATIYGVVNNYLNMVIGDMLNARLSEVTQQPNAPFVAGYAYDGDFFVSKTKDAFTTIAIAKTGGVEEALAAILRETERVNKFGFTASEYARAQANVLSLVESQYNERDKMRNGSYVQEYVSHFTDGGYIPGIETEYQLYSQIAPNFPLEEVNKYIQELLTDENVVIAISGPDNEEATYPTKEEIATIFANSRTEEIEAYAETVSNEPLIAKLPKAGKVKKTTTDKRFGTTEWKLSNGAKVIIKPTDFKSDEILMLANSKGGKYQYTPEEMIDLYVFSHVLDAGGLGSFSAIDLQKVLAGKVVSISSPNLSNYAESLSGKSSPKDLETFMQLLYLSFTDVRRDTDAFESWKQRTYSMLENADANPRTALSDSLNATIYDHSPWMKRLKADDLATVDYDRIFELWGERFGNAGDFTFTFVGNVDLDTFKPLVEQYIASLPAKGKAEKTPKSQVAMREENTTNEFDRAGQTPKSTVYAYYHGDIDSNLENRVLLSMFKQVMDIVYTKTIREEEGGTYGVSTQASINAYSSTWSFLLAFDTDPELKTKLLERAHKELMQVVEQGAEVETLDKVKEFMLKKHKEQLRENNYWLSSISDYQLDGEDDLNHYEEIVATQNVETLKAFSQQLFAEPTLLEVIMNITTE